VDPILGEPPGVPTLGDPFPDPPGISTMWYHPMGSHAGGKRFGETPCETPRGGTPCATMTGGHRLGYTTLWTTLVGHPLGEPICCPSLVTRLMDPSWGNRLADNPWVPHRGTYRWEPPKGDPAWGLPLGDTAWGTPFGTPLGGHLLLDPPWWTPL
jgi:hypothetical protein